jgi:hypothetical protein
VACGIRTSYLLEHVALEPSQLSEYLSNMGKVSTLQRIFNLKEISRHFKGYSSVSGGRYGVCGQYCSFER